MKISLKKRKGPPLLRSPPASPFPLGTRPKAAQETSLEINLRSVHVCVKSEKHLSTCFLPGGQKRSKTRHLQGGWWGYVDLVMIGIQALGIWPWRARRGGLPSRPSEHVSMETGTRGQQAWQGMSTVCMTRSQKKIWRTNWSHPQMGPFHKGLVFKLVLCSLFVSCL